MKTTLAFALAAVAAGLGCNEKADQDPQLSKLESNATFALVVESKINMGCLVNQRPIKDAIGDVSRGIAVAATGNVSEDSSSEQALYLGFAPNSNSGVDFSPTFRVWVEPEMAGGEARFDLQKPHLEWKKDALVLSFSARGSGTLRLEPLLARSSTLEPVWRTCPEADIVEPFQGTFLIAQNIEAALEPKNGHKLGSEYKTFEAKISRDRFEHMKELSQSMAALDRLAAQFGTAESRWLWSEEKVTATALASALASEKSAPSLNVKISPDGRTPIIVGQADFMPLLRFKLAVATPSGDRKGAEVWIGVNEP